MHQIHLITGTKLLNYASLSLIPDNVQKVPIGSYTRRSYNLSERRKGLALNLYMRKSTMAQKHYVTDYVHKSIT